MNSFKKSLYVFLCSLMGVLLFVLLQRSVFLIFYMLGANVISPEYLLFDYATFTFALFFGWWYGIWLGLVWYKAVYEDGEGVGFVKFLRLKLAGSGNAGVERFAPAQTWDLSDLLGSEEVENLKEGESMTPTLSIFEENTILLSDSGPVHANSLHEHGQRKASKLSDKASSAKKTVRKPRKAAASL